MFDFAWSELGLIAVVAMILIGPKDMPVAIRSVTGWIRKARRMAAELAPGDPESVTVIATGGLAPLVIDEVSVIDAYEPWLTLIGLRLVFERNNLSAWPGASRGVPGPGGSRSAPASDPSRDAPGKSGPAG